jgi:hypothetical protein
MYAWPLHVITKRTHYREVFVCLPLCICRKILNGSRLNLVLRVVIIQNIIL